jgi:hypothetical protein
MAGINTRKLYKYNTKYIGIIGPGRGFSKKKRKKKIG